MYAISRFSDHGMKQLTYMVIQAIGNVFFIIASAANPSQPLLNIWVPQLSFNVAVVFAMCRELDDLT